MESKSDRSGNHRLSSLEFSGRDAAVQVDVALMLDAVDVVVHGLRSLLTLNPDVFRRSFRRGQVFNNETRGIHCDRVPLVPWVHGRTILSHLLGVNFTGTTGPVTFDPVTGQRSNYRLDLMELSFNTELHKVTRTVSILNTSNMAYSEGAVLWLPCIATII